jgi:hypothetical protein
VGCPWQGWPGAPADFCEASLCAWVRQPGNTWSNLGFFVAAAVVHRATATRNRDLRPMAWILVLMGAGSIAFHATETRAAQWLDWAGMYAMTAWMVGHAGARLFALGPRGRVGVVGALFALGMSSLAVPGAPVRTLFAVANLACPALEAALALRPRTRAPSYRWFFAAYAALLPAVVLWVADERRVLCDPDNHLFSGHAAWHLLDALMFACSYAWYASLGRVGSRA